MTIPAYGENPHGVYNKKDLYANPWSQFTYNWLGAKVKVKILGQWVEGVVEEVDDLHNQVTMRFWDRSKQISVMAPYQAFRRIEP